MPDADTPTARSPLAEVAAVFLRLGVIGFGGPAVHIAMMEDELVRKRRWLTHEKFMDMVSACNLIPGPNSTEMAIHLGYLRAGFPGLLLAGLCFITPAALLTCALAWAYVEYGATPRAAPLMHGVQAAVLAVIFSMVWRLGKTAAKSRRLVLVALGAGVAYHQGVNELIVLFAGGIVGALWLHGVERSMAANEGKSLAGAIAVLGSTQAPQHARAAASIGAATAGAAAGVAVAWWEVGLFFLKVGSVLYGSGYVLLAFLEGGLVRERQWLTHQQLLDAVSAGQFTPGPVFTTATFVGYVVARSGGASSGLPAAAAATIGIFLPAFVFVALTAPYLHRLRANRLTAHFLDAVNAVSIALMAAVALSLARDVLPFPIQAPADLRPWLIAAAAAVALLRFKVNPALLILGGAAVGLMFG